jgi:hypothetical protein
MTLRLIGAGVGRTGTLSLKTATEQLLGAPCYHMLEAITHAEHVSLWSMAAAGEEVDWPAFLGGYVGTTDFPACLFWPEILAANPDAVVVLSTRLDSGIWWESASRTIFTVDETKIPAEMTDWLAMWRAVAAARFTADWSDENAARTAYEGHNAEVRSSVPSGRLVEWQPGDGWEPLCRALGVEVPDAPFPHVNTRAAFPLG